MLNSLAVGSFMKEKAKNLVKVSLSAVAVTGAITNMHLHQLAANVQAKTRLRHEI
jgi:hypothetical protein